jgi:hypothetical protein
LLGLLVALIAVSGASASAGDVGAPSFPTIELDRTAAGIGEEVVVTLRGWPDRVVTLSVCGNLARRGSVDCNQVASQGVALNRDGSPTLTGFAVPTPPTTCPCVIRASSTRQDAVAVAPIELHGVPVGPLVGTAADPPVRVSLGARRATGGLIGSLRSALGGPTTYEVTVLVHNRSAETLTAVAVAGAATRGGDDVGALTLPAPGPLEPGATWEQVVRSTLPAPVVGTFGWEVTASGAGPAAHAELARGIRPVWLLVLGLVLVLDVGAIAWRWIGRRRRKRRARRALVPGQVADASTRSVRSSVTVAS